MGECYRYAKKLAEPCSHRRQREPGDCLPLGTPKMRHNNDLCAIAAQFIDSRERCTDTAIISDRSTVKRNVEISADKDPLAFKISKILKCLHNILSYDDI